MTGCVLKREDSIQTYLDREEAGCFYKARSYMESPYELATWVSSDAQQKRVRFARRPYLTQPK